MKKVKLSVEEFMNLDDSEFYDPEFNPDAIVVEIIYELADQLLGPDRKNPRVVNDTLMGQATVDALRKHTSMK